MERGVGTDAGSNAVLSMIFRADLDRGLATFVSTFGALLVALYLVFTLPLTALPVLALLALGFLALLVLAFLTLTLVFDLRLRLAAVFVLEDLRLAFGFALVGGFRIWISLFARMQ
jgi:hypothetical protein